MNSIDNSIDEYISKNPEDIQKILKKIRKTIQEAAPEATEKISYGMPTFYLNKNLVHFAANKKHIGLYPTASGVEKFKKELEKYKTSKGAIQFQYSEPIPYDLIKKIVKFRVQENKTKK
ncbi:MAG: iron chaperone [Methanobacteriaceae archaeon]